MMDLNAKIVDRSIENAMLLLEGVPKGFEKAMYRSFNRGLQKGRTETARAVSKRYTVRQKEVRPTIKMKNATSNNLNAEMISTGARLPLSKYKHAPQTDTTGSRYRAIKVGVKKGGLKPLGQSFIWKGRVMQRLGANRLPIQQKFGPAVPVMLNNEGVAEDIQSAMADTVLKRLDHETKRLLEGNK